MTREERAKSLSSHLLIAAARLRRSEITRDEYDSIAKDKIESFADAEAAAMRERAAGVATSAAEAARPYANGVGLGPATEKHRMLEAERIAAAIRNLPATGEVGRG